MKINKLFDLGHKLRQAGYSFREIHEELGIAKSTSYSWFRDVELSEDAKKSLKRKGDDGRQKGWMSNALILQNKKMIANSKAVDDIKKLNFTPELLRLVASLLYWAEGAKSSGGLYFSNSDPQMVKVYMRIMRTCFFTEEKAWRASLHLHEYHNRQKQIEFWSKITGIAQNRISVYMKPNTGLNKRFGYPGCIQVRYNSMDLFRYVEAMYNSLVQEVGA